MPKHDEHQPRGRGSALARSFRITILYFLFGALWIILTEMAVIAQVGEFTAVSAINIGKGLLYVLLTACLIFILVHNGFRSLININARLQKSEASLLEAQRLAHIGSYELDMASNHIACTEELLNILGIDPSTFDGDVNTILNRIHPDDRAMLSRGLQAEHSGLKDEKMVYRIEKPDGDERIVSIRVARVFGEQGVFLRSSGTVQDITESSRAAAALTKERDRAEKYLDIAATIFLIVDGKGVVTLINRTGCETLGMQKSEIVGRNWVKTFIAEADGLGTEQVLQKIAKGGEGYEIHESHMLTGNGALRNIVWRSVALPDEEGHAGSILSSGVDVTELKAALNNLRESERSKSVLLANLPGMAFRCSPLPGRAMQFVSDGCLALTGFAPQALIGEQMQAYDRMICEEYRQPLRTEIEQSIRRRVPMKLEYEIVTVSGDKKWVLETSQGVFNGQGVVEAIEGIIIDITESKKRSLQIQYLNDHDYLTGLYNRQYFEGAKVRLSLPQMLPLAIILTDINGLKLVNDAFGLECGDRIVKKAAEILTCCCGENDVLARTGGDEFSILAPCSGHAEADNLIAAIRAAFELYNSSISDKTQVISLSIAHSVRERADMTVADAIKQAEESLSRQKLLDKRSHHNAMLASIMATMYERSFETEEHAERIASLSIRIGGKMNLTQRQLDELHLFSMLHDIGKVGIRDQILKKPGRLTDLEWSEMKKHPEIGYRIAMSTPDLSTVAEYILTHHEKWDGTGYPRGLRGYEIPLLSRILAVADAYDAMTEDRVYRKGMHRDRAVEEIIRSAGTQFDPDIVAVFREIVSEA